MMNTRQENDVTDHTGLVYAENNIELSWLIVPCTIFEKKNRYDNDVINCTGLFHAKTKTKLLGHIWPSAAGDENHTGQWHDWLYKCGLRQKRNWVIVTDRTRCDPGWKIDRTTTWSLIWVQSSPKTILRSHNISNRLWSVMKTKNDDNMIDYISLVYA